MLHIINKSPMTCNTLDSCLEVATGGDVLLIEDAIYAVTAGNAFEGKIKEAMSRFKIYALLPDVEARGLADRVMEGVSTVGYDGFVDLVVANKNCQSWL